MSGWSRAQRWLPAAVVVVVVMLLGGCRRGIVRVDTSPPGADVYLQGRHAVSPAVYEFSGVDRNETLWYGVDYTLLAAKDGYATRTVYVPIRSPWWLWPPLDFVVELLPFPITDRHEVQLALTPLEPEANR